MKINCARFLVLAAALCFSHSILAQNTFGQLPAQEQNLLKAAEALWSKLDAQARSELRMHARHWLKLSVAEQQELLLKQKQWDKLSFADKAQARARYSAWQSLGALDQAKINGAFRQWQKLPVEKQLTLKTKFAQQLPEYQQAWVLGPTLGKEAQALNEWLLFIPQEQVKPWLMLLRGLSAEDRGSLIQHGKRWNQQQRDTFRTRLLSAPAAARLDMIEKLP